jgi:hypothetical protein
MGHDCDSHHTIGNMLNKLISTLYLCPDPNILSLRYFLDVRQSTKWMSYPNCSLYFKQLDIDLWVHMFIPVYLWVVGEKFTCVGDLLLLLDLNNDWERWFGCGVATWSASLLTRSPPSITLLSQSVPLHPMFPGIEQRSAEMFCVLYVVCFFVNTDYLYRLETNWL